LMSAWHRITFEDAVLRRRITARVSASWKGLRPDMNLKSLLLCSDERIGRVLRRTLGDLDIAVEHCTSAEVALRLLTRDRFEAIIVDCAGPGAADVLRAARTAPCNKRAVQSRFWIPPPVLRSAFEIGAHFVLYKPVSAERAKASFRAARALMKRERRRNLRVSVNLRLEMVNVESGVRINANTTDVGEGGFGGFNAPAQQAAWADGIYHSPFQVPTPA